MNKIININLAGRLIPIDEHAYESLQTYITRLKDFFSREEGGDEIVRDMEDRIGELFQDKLKKGAPCIVAEDVDSMMKVMGSPEEIEQETADEDPSKTKAYQASDKRNRPANERLSRSKDDSLIGGVCGGIAQYFRIDPIIVRLAFVFISLAWGTGILIYLLLWAILPVGSATSQPLKRRLYRNPDNKVVGGVCSGIAAYLNVDPVIPRIIFAIPLLGMIFFGIIDEDIFFFPMFTGGLPTLVLLYIILWISLPQATTVTEKLEMRGERVDVQNLSQAIKNQQVPHASKPKTSNQGLKRTFGFFVKIFVFCILGIILIILSSVLIAVVATILGLSSATFFAFPLRDLITDNQLHQQLLWLSITIVLLLPFVAIIRLLVNMVSGRKSSWPKWLNLSLTLVFIAAVFVLFGIVGLIVGDFKTQYSDVENVSLIQPSNDTLIVRQGTQEGGRVTLFDYDDVDWQHIRFIDDSSIAFNHVHLYFRESPDSLYHMTIHRSAHGKNIARAKRLAQALPFSYHQEGDVLYIPDHFMLPDNHPYRNQKIMVEIKVPRGKVYLPENLSESLRRDYRIRLERGNFRYEERYENKNWRNNQYHQMKASKDNFSTKEVYED